MGMMVKHFLANGSAVEISHPPYSPDCIPASFFYIP
jgi:hypothetical protein